MTKICYLLNAILILLLPCFLSAESMNDSIFFNRAIEQTSIEDIALSFLETPYVSCILESGDDKNVIVNLRELDCVTFIESVSAIYLCKKNDKSNFNYFKYYLTTLRYRDSKPEGYMFRLHYFTEWLESNRQKGYLGYLPISSQDSLRKPIFFMSTNYKLYKQLQDSAIVIEMKQIENSISRYVLPYIPSAKLSQCENVIRSGDIIAFTTTVKGLDVSHTAFAYRIPKDSSLHFIHASTIEKKVVVSKESLLDYVTRSKKISGIIVSRFK